MCILGPKAEPAAGTDVLLMSKAGKTERISFMTKYKQFSLFKSYMNPGIKTQ